MLWLEYLEPRLCPSRVFLVVDTLVVVGNSKSDSVTIRLTPDSSQVQVTLNSAVFAFPAGSVNLLNVNAGSGNDKVSNLTNIPSEITCGSGNDVVFAGTGNDVIDGGLGNDILDGDSGDDVLIGGNGNDSLVSIAGNDMLLGGNGNDTLYDIVGTNTHDGGKGKNQLIVNGGDAYQFSPSDRVVVFKARSSQVMLEDGVLYLQSDGVSPVHASVSEVGKQILVLVDGLLAIFDKVYVKHIAFLGTIGNDSFINTTSIKSVAYGSSGDDLLAGGNSNDILKGGAGNDVIVGNRGADDLNGNLDNDVIFGGLGRDLLRADLFDTVLLSNRDTVVGI